MTLDTLMQSLGSSERNLAAHSLLLVQQQQQAAPVPHAQPGCGGAQALLQCCYHKLSHSAQQRTRGIIVLSLEHSSRHWLQSSSVASGAPSPTAPPRLILDACRNRFLMASADAATHSAPSATTATSAVAVAAAATTVSAAVSEAVAHPSQPGTSVRTLAHHEIHDLRALRSIIETAAASMHADYEAAHASRPPTAPAASAATAAAPRDPFSLDGDAHADPSFACAGVSVVVDDVMSLIVRFGASPTLAFLQSLKAAPKLKLALLAAIDLDGLAALAPVHVGSGTSNAQSLHSHVGVHTHLGALASTTVSIRAVRPLSGSASVSALAATVHVLHKRASGKVTNVVEEMEVQPGRGVVRKMTAAVAAAAAASAGSAEGRQAATAATSAASVMHQFGSSFSLDLTAKAKSARAQTVLPYQHTGQSSLGADQQPTSSLDLVDDDIISDDDHDFDDPDDDLDV